MRMSEMYIARSSAIAARMLGGEMMIMSAVDSMFFALNEVAVTSCPCGHKAPRRLKRQLRLFVFTVIDLESISKFSIVTKTGKSQIVTANQQETSLSSQQQHKFGMKCTPDVDG